MLRRSRILCSRQLILEFAAMTTKLPADAEDMLTLSNDFFCRYSRQDKSLGLLTKRFVSLLMNSPDGTVHLNQVSNQLAFQLIENRQAGRTRNHRAANVEITDIQRSWFRVIFSGSRFIESRTEKKNLRYYQRSRRNRSFGEDNQKHRSMAVGMASLIILFAIVIVNLIPS